MTASPWKCEGCGWTNVGYVRECDGCGEPVSTALLSRSGALAELEASEARARAARSPNPSAGVGEARPADLPNARADSPQNGLDKPELHEQIEPSVGAPAEEQPDARATGELLKVIADSARDKPFEDDPEREAAWKEIKRRCGENKLLREQLDAARLERDDFAQRLHAWQQGEMG